MAVRIRLTRMSKNAPVIVWWLLIPVFSDGRFIEILGQYNPITEPVELVIDKENVGMVGKGRTTLRYSQTAAEEGWSDPRCRSLR